MHQWWSQIYLMCRGFHYKVLWPDLNNICCNNRQSTAFKKILFEFKKEVPASVFCWIKIKIKTRPAPSVWKTNGLRNNSILFFCNGLTFLFLHPKHAKPILEIWVLIAYGSREGSGKPAQMQILTTAFTALWHFL